MLALGAGLAAGALPGMSAAQSKPAAVLTRLIPKTKEPLPVIGLGTAIIFDNLNAGRGRLPDAAMRKRMVAFIETQ